MGTDSSTFSADDVAAALHRLFIGAPHATLRKEDRQKAQELLPLLGELRRAVGGKKRGVLVDACAGKSALGLLGALLVLPRSAPRAWRLVVVERAPDRVAAARAAAALVQAENPSVVVDVVPVDVVGDGSWLPTSTKDEPVVVTALHACGAASDAIIDRCASSPPSSLLLVPCCYGAHPDTVIARPPHPIPGQRIAAAFANVLPRQGLVGRRLAAALIDAERTLRLEAAGFAVDVVEFVAATVTPHNLLWRCKKVDEPPRRARAAALLARLAHARTATAPPGPAPTGEAGDDPTA